MKTKKFLAAIAALTIVCGAVPTQPFADLVSNMVITSDAASNIESGSCGENAKYEFNTTTGVLTISGTGTIQEYAFDVEDGIAR